MVTLLTTEPSFTLLDYVAKEIKKAEHAAVSLQDLQLLVVSIDCSAAVKVIFFSFEEKIRLTEDSTSQRASELAVVVSDLV